MFDPLLLYNESRHLSILIVEDHLSLRTRIVEILSDLFARVDEAQNGVDALEQYIRYQEENGVYYDLVLSDIQMPCMNGIDLTAEIYAHHEEQPIIILSAHQDAQYLLALINFGVAQFITKPVEQDQMLETLYNVCKKINKKPLHTSADIITLGDTCIWDTRTQTLKVDNNVVSLTKHEIYFMELFSKHLDKVCSIDDILNHFFLHNIDINADNIRSSLTRLRKKLPKNSITSVYGLGYRLSSR
ncbi:MAG: DNA-binding response regulator [Sulfurimonas sp.]|nr:MAG: DNA-binding response regulator [Sulfurimonas sp.]